MARYNSNSFARPRVKTYYIKAFFLLLISLNANPSFAKMKADDVDSKIFSYHFSEHVPLSDGKIGIHEHKHKKKGKKKKISLDGSHNKVCGLETISLSNNANEFVAASTAGIVFPGAMIQGVSLKNGSPALIPAILPRAGGKLTLNVISGSAKNYSVDVDKTTNASVTNAINNHILHNLDYSTPAHLSLKINQVYSDKQLAASMGASFPGTGFDSKISASFKSGHSYFIVDFRQKFFEISFASDGDGSPAGFFDLNHLKEPLFKERIGPNNPPLYVNSVSYGRIFFMLFESKKKISKADFSSQFHQFTANGTFSKELANMSVTGYALGGNASEAIGAMLSGTSTKLDSIGAPLHKYLMNANFSASNPAAAISYSLSKVKDSMPVTLGSLVEQKVQNCKKAEKTCPKKELASRSAYAWGQKGLNVRFFAHKLKVGHKAHFKKGSAYGYTVGKGGSACARVYWTKGSWECSPNSDSTSGKWKQAEKLNLFNDNACDGKHKSFGSRIKIWSTK